MIQISLFYNWPMPIVTSLSTSFCIICTFYKQCFHILFQFIYKGIEDQWGEDRFLHVWTRSNPNRKMSLHLRVTFCGLLVSQILIPLIQVALILWVLFFFFSSSPVRLWSQFKHHTKVYSSAHYQYWLNARFLTWWFFKSIILDNWKISRGTYNTFLILT